MPKKNAQELIQSSLLPQTFKDHLLKEIEKNPEASIRTIFDKEIDRLTFTLEKLDNIDEDIESIEQQLSEINRIHKTTLAEIEEAKTELESKLAKIRKEGKARVQKSAQTTYRKQDQKKINKLRETLQDKPDAPPQA